MAELEKVLKGLECCKQWSNAGIYEGYLPEICENCPRAELHTDAQECHEALLNDALALLKAQQPRMLTVGEIRSLSACPVWRETKNSRQNLYQGWVLLYEIQKGMGITGERFGITEPNGRMSWYKIDDYCKTWRCWNKRPTDEQRKAVAWDE